MVVTDLYVITLKNQLQITIKIYAYHWVIKLIKL